MRRSRGSAAATVATTGQRRRNICAGKGKGGSLTFGALNTEGCPDVFYHALLATGPEEGDTMQRTVATFVKCDMLGVTKMKGHHPDKVEAADERVWAASRRRSTTHERLGSVSSTPRERRS